jgi:ribonuclease Z
VLIHEATFDDDMEAEATSKRHSMTKEAVRTGVDARVYRTILTHFSQRYPKIPVWDHSFSARTGVAFDLMAVNFGHLELMPHLIQPLKHVFADETCNGEPASVPSTEV